MMSPYIAMLVVCATVLIWLVWRAKVFFRYRCYPCAQSSVSPISPEIHAESFGIPSIPKDQPEKTTDVRVHLDISRGCNASKQETDELEGCVEEPASQSRHSRIWPTTSVNALALLSSMINMIHGTRNFPQSQPPFSEHSRSSVSELEDEKASEFKGKPYREESVGSLGLSALCSKSSTGSTCQEMIEANPANTSETLEKSKRLLQRLQSLETLRKQENEAKEQAELAIMHTKTRAVMYKAAVLRDLQVFRDQHAGVDEVPNKKEQRPMLRDSCSHPDLNILPPRPQTWVPGIQHLAAFKQRSKETHLSHSVPAIPPVAGDFTTAPVGGREQDSKQQPRQNNHNAIAKPIQNEASLPVATTSTNVNMPRLAAQMALAAAKHNPYPKDYVKRPDIQRATGFYASRDSSFKTRVAEPSFSSSSHAPSLFPSSSHAPSAMLFTTSSHADTSLCTSSHPTLYTSSHPLPFTLPPSSHAPASQSDTRMLDSASDNSSRSATPALAFKLAPNNSSNSVTPTYLPTKLSNSATPTPPVLPTRLANSSTPTPTLAPIRLANSSTPNILPTSYATRSQAVPSSGSDSESTVDLSENIVLNGMSDSIFPSTGKSRRVSEGGVPGTEQDR
eukprot:gb/GEZN01002618.1/.p1 GENE.gb/GEZN01002618.1/~~gb/GEZN01002618.1/.p1  ORF type:complete len:619 (+),score=72.45 gb/GEZN01002618.1/:103-1959(+)